jgi:hypothetical protein
MMKGMHQFLRAAGKREANTLQSHETKTEPHGPLKIKPKHANCA